MGFRCPSPRLSQAHHPFLCRSRRTRPHAHPSPFRNFTESAWPKSAPSKPVTPLPPSNSPSPSTGSAIRAVDPDHLVLRPGKMRSGQRFSYLALEPEETRALNAAYHERIHLRPIQSQTARSGGFHPNGSRTACQRPLPPKRHGHHGSHWTSLNSIFLNTADPLLISSGVSPV
jgi:hypothetical protein